jgi:hypothetical protein
MRSWSGSKTRRRSGLSGASFERGREFVYATARVLEQRLFATVFEGASATGVVDALRAYRNDDGGFGHGLEPDTRAPASQPVDVWFAFDTIVAAGVRADDLVLPACDWLTTLGVPVPIMLPSIRGYPQARHWRETTDFPPGLFGTIGATAALHALGVEHPWRDAATEWCLGELALDPLDDAHTISWALQLLEHVSDEQLVDRVTRALPDARYFLADPDDESYGLTPLEYAPTPESRWRALFDDAIVDAHLDRLAAKQHDDGGWDVTWEPPSEAARLEWRGILTVKNLRVLRTYGRL